MFKANETIRFKRNAMGPLLKTQDSRPKTTSAYTLIELLVTVGILAVLFSLSIGILIRLGNIHGFEARVAQVQSLVRKARNYARLKQYPSVVVVEPRENAIYAKGLRTIGLWHFENFMNSSTGELLTAGAYGINAKVVNCYSERGYIRNALEFGTDEGLEGTESYLRVPSQTIGDAPIGLVITLWCYPGDFWSETFKRTFNVTDLPEQEEFEDKDEERREKVSARERYRRWLSNDKWFDLVTKGDSYYVWLTGGYAVEVGFNTYYSVKTPDGVVKPNAWNEIRVIYDCDKLVVSVNCVPYSTTEYLRKFSLFYIDENGIETPASDMPEDLRTEYFPKRIQLCDGPLTISGPVNSFYGKIDEVHIQAYTTPEVYRLNHASLMGYRQVIHFTPQGKLNGEYHSEPVVIELTDDPHYEAPKPIKFDGPVTIGGPVDVEKILAREREKNRDRSENSEKREYRTARITIDMNGNIH